MELKDDKEAKDVIWARDPDARAMLDEIAAFDSRLTGKVNMTTTIHRVLVEETARMKASPEYRKWKRERDQTARV
jgi:hypothetical protein